ncbi:MAG: endonuclease domain-containing protein [Gammaproteobacteria bacterium]|nr:endonuclease domain-containing protein [Gammaproteobacteria bacterium]
MKNTQRARELRKNQTDAENLLWLHIRNRQLNGCKFRRQFPIGSYIVDFACISLKLIIEVDGSQHMSNIDYDNTRTQTLENHGFQVIRFWNNAVLTETDSVLESLTLSQREREIE